MKHLSLPWMSLAAAALLMTSPTYAVEPGKTGYAAAGRSANELIGKKVVNAQDETLGKVHDIILDLESGTASYAVITHGSAFTRNRVAVPLSALHWTDDGKAVQLSATRDQLQSATKSNTGAWSSVADAEWAKNVDGFYGTPGTNGTYHSSASTYNSSTPSTSTADSQVGNNANNQTPVVANSDFRSNDSRTDATSRTPGSDTRSIEARNADRNKTDIRNGDTRSNDLRTGEDRNNDTRRFVRDPAPKGGELLMTPEDAVLCEKISENLDVVNVRVQNGVTHLYGKVASDEERQRIETKVRGVQGVNTVESHLRVKNP